MSQTDYIRKAIEEMNHKIEKQQDMKLDEAVNQLRGKEGSKVTITVLRKKETKPLKITMTREIIHITSIKDKLLENDFGYIRITRFNESTGKQLHAAAANLVKKTDGHLKGLILDLRNNPGGLLDAAVEVSDAFLHSDSLKAHDNKIVYTKGRVAEADFLA